MGEDGAAEKEQCRQSDCAALIRRRSAALGGAQGVSLALRLAMGYAPQVSGGEPDAA
jgi:hypothetical protein